MALRRRIAVISILCVGCMATSSVRAEPTSPERGMLDALVASVVEHPEGEDAAAAVERVWAAWDDVGPEAVVGALERIHVAEGADRWVRDAAAWHLAEAEWRRGRRDEATAAADRLGVVRSWLVLGPLDNEGDRGLDDATSVEAHPRAAIDLEAGVEGARREVSWRSIDVGAPLGVLRLDGYLHPTTEICALAATALTLERASEVELRGGAEGAVVLWLDDSEVIRDRVYRRVRADRFALRARLSRGTHRVLARVCSDDRAPALVLRAFDAEGRPLGAELSGAAARAGAAVTGRVRRPVRSLRTPFRGFWEMAEADEPPPPARALAAAWYLELTGADDDAEPLAPALAALGAGDVGGDRLDVDAQILAAKVAVDHNVARRRLEALVRRAPDDARALAALAEVVLESPCPQEAIPLARRAVEAAPRSVAALALRASVTERLGLSATALAELDRALGGEAAAPPRLLELAMRLARSARRPDRARALGRRLALARADSAALHRELAELARDQGDFDAALDHLRDLERAAWHEPETLVAAAELFDQVGRFERADALLRAVHDRVPDCGQAWSARGRLLAGADRRDEAIAALRRSLELEPQDQEARDLLTHLLDEAPLEDRFMEEPEVFLARRGHGDGEHASWLLDLTVVRVHPSGLSSRFRQIAVEILDEEGASDFRTHGIAFVPEEQQVTVRRARVIHADGSVEQASGRWLQQLSDPSIRMYYDERAEVIELPRLGPGDVVEYAYRIDDVARDNVMGDYFGDVALLQGFEPRRRVAYVLVHPASRRIVAEPPALPTLRHERQCDEDGGTDCVQIWEATEVPGLRREEDQPPRAELAARLVLSTYEDWASVGRWYWGLVRDQLVPDDALREVVRELTEGLSDPADRVQAIHGWVVDHTRYVALEFGIHGYQPYRVTQIVDRGFGDCKDKASLLVTMLDLAGIEAALVLLRTRHAGRIPPRPPGLSVFDHAIAYVPSLDLFLDGTAEQNGTNELPWMDQGVSALIVRRGGAVELVTTPVDSPDRNVEHDEVSVAVPAARDGAPHVTLRRVVRGHLASRLRFHFQAAALRQERLEALLAGTWPGARLVSHRFLEVSDRQQPVRLEAEIEAPSVILRRGTRRAVELAEPRDLVRRWARRTERQTPLELRSPPHRDVEERVITLPEGVAVVDVPEDVHLETPFGSLELTIRREGRSVRATTRLTVARERVEPRDYNAFRRFCQDVDRALERRLILE